MSSMIHWPLSGYSYTGLWDVRISRRTNASRAPRHTHMYPRGSLLVMYRAFVTWWSGLAYGRKRVPFGVAGSVVGEGRGSCGMPKRGLVYSSVREFASNAAAPRQAQVVAIAATTAGICVGAAEQTAGRREVYAQGGGRKTCVQSGLRPGPSSRGGKSVGRDRRAIHAKIKAVWLDEPGSGLRGATRSADRTPATWCCKNRAYG